jgi:hypothetical protein
LVENLGAEKTSQSLFVAFAQGLSLGERSILRLSR